jgi:hypothetical protein
LIGDKNHLGKENDEFSKIIGPIYILRAYQK